MNAADALPSTAARLDGFGFVNAAGPDAASFLQSQLSSDLRSLEDRGAQWSALLNPQGRVIAFFGLFRMAVEQFRLLLPAESVPTTIDHLRRFQLRSKLVLTADPTPAVGGWQSAMTPPVGSLRTASRWFDAGDASSPAMEADAADRWALADIDEGLTWLSASQREQFVAQMLGLEQLGAISLRKGCYPGQEIIARAHFRGAVKRRVTRLQLSAPVQPGDRVLPMDGGSECGLVLSSAATGGEQRALAVLAIEPSLSQYVIHRDGQLVAQAERL